MRHTVTSFAFASAMVALLIGSDAGCSSGALTVSCLESAGANGCYCVVREGESPAPSAGDVVVLNCSPSAYPGTECCATPGWPGLNPNGSTIGSCECWPATASHTCPNTDYGLDDALTFSVSSCKLGGTSGHSDAGTPPPQCSDTGYCSPTTDACACGTSCVHIGPGDYMCGFTCGSDTECKATKNPIDGSTYSACQPGLDTSTMTYDSYCVP